MSLLTLSTVTLLLILIVYLPAQIRLVRGEFVDESGCPVPDWIGFIRAARNSQEQNLEAVSDLPGGQVIFFPPYHINLSGRCQIYFRTTFLDTWINSSLSLSLHTHFFFCFLSVWRFSTACWEKSRQERSSAFGTPTLWPSGTTSRPRPLPRTTRKVKEAANNDPGEEEEKEEKEEKEEEEDGVLKKGAFCLEN